MDGRSMSMSSVGKVVYESVHRHPVDSETASTQRGGGGGGNVLYCPSPYATTRVQLYFPTDQTSINNDQNCYDMPLLKQARNIYNI